MLSARPSSRRTLWLFISLVVIAGIGWRFSGNLGTSRQFLAVQAAFRSRDWNSALTLLDTCPQSTKTSAKWHFFRARAARRSGRSKEASQSLQLAAQLGWNQQDVLREEILLKAQSGHIHEVETQLRNLTLAGAADEIAEEIYEATARGYMASLRFADAMQCLKFWSEWQTDNPLPQLWLGEIHLRVENPAAAAQAFEQVLKLDPKHLEGRLRLADVRLSQLQIEKAELLFEDCVKQSPDSATALLGLAECKRRQGNSEEANRLLYDALTLDLSPEQQGVALASLGQVALENGKYNRASRLLEEALEKNPNDPAVHLALAAAMLAQGRKEPAAEHRETAKAITERHARVVGLTRQAIQEPDNAKLRCEAGLILLEQGLLTSGAQWLDSAIQVDPNYAPAHDGLAKYFRSVGDHRAAAEQERIAERLHVASSTDTKGSTRP